MELCEACGTENREKARYCIGCARALPIKDPSAHPDGDGARPTKKVRRKSRRKASGSQSQEAEAASAQMGAVRRTAALVMVLGAAIVVGAWMLGAFDRAEGLTGAESATTEAVLPVDAPVPAPAGVLAVAANPEMPSSMLPAADGLSAEEVLIERSREDQLTETVLREERRAELAKKVLEQSAKEEKEAELRARAERAAQRQRAEDARRAATATEVETPPPVAVPSSKADVNSPPSSAASAASDAPARRVSVEQACAHTTNFLSRDLCRINACENAANAKDPICVWYRELDEARKQKQGIL